MHVIRITPVWHVIRITPVWHVIRITPVWHVIRITPVWHVIRITPVWHVIRITPVWHVIRITPVCLLCRRLLLRSVEYLACQQEAGLMWVVPSCFFSVVCSARTSWTEESPTQSSCSLPRSKSVVDSIWNTRQHNWQTGHETRQHHWQVRPDADRTWY